MLVRFLTKVRPYNAGEVADFPDGEARRLVGRGLAVAVQPAASAPVATVVTAEQTVIKPMEASRPLATGGGRKNRR